MIIAPSWTSCLLAILCSARTKLLITPWGPWSALLWMKIWKSSRNLWWRLSDSQWRDSSLCKMLCVNVRWPCRLVIECWGFFSESFIFAAQTFGRPIKIRSSFSQRDPLWPGFEFRLSRLWAKWTIRYSSLSSLDKLTWLIKGSYHGQKCVHL